MQLKSGGKAIIIFGILAAVGMGIWKADGMGYFSPKQAVESSVPTKVVIAGNDTLIQSQAQTIAGLAPVASKQPMKIVTIGWNATQGLLLANGGKQTAAGSLMAKRGISLEIERQDMYDQQLAELIKFSSAVASGAKQPAQGAAFAIIMGDGYPAYIAGAQETLAKIGQQLEVVGMVGFSRGEDKCMMEAKVKANPQLAKGSLISGVPRDGDLHICFQWAAENGIAINPNAKTYDPEAMNIAEVDDQKKAGQNLIAGQCETRPVVKNNKQTGESRKVCLTGAAVWTPVDVTIATMKGGYVSVASTKEYRNQMAATIIGNKQWMAENPLYVQNMLAAAFEGGDMVRTDDDASTKASGFAATVFNEENSGYWKKYFRGVAQQDKTGLAVELGGSTTAGLGDNLIYFGVNGGQSIYKSVYNVFAAMDNQYYPVEMPKIVPYDLVVNTSYLKALSDKAGANVGVVDKPVYVENAQSTGTFAKRAVSIEFETGKATFKPTAIVKLNELIDQLSINGLTIQLNGHTDNVGDPASNQALSKARADAVKAFFVANAGSSFPQERIKTRGYGDTTPIADNKTADGRAANRRVDVILQTTN